MDKKQHLRSLLAKSILVDPVQKEALLKNIDKFKENHLDELIRLFENAATKQESFIKKALIANPDLLNDVKQAARKEVKKIRVAKEANDRGEEKKVLDELDRELDSLIDES